MSLILGHSLGVREKILATPSVGVGGETHVCRNKGAEWASSKKTSNPEGSFHSQYCHGLIVVHRVWEGIEDLQRRHVEGQGSPRDCNF